MMPYLPNRLRVATLQGYDHGMINYQVDSSQPRKIPTSLENHDGCVERKRPDPTREAKAPQIVFERRHSQV